MPDTYWPWVLVTPWGRIVPKTHGPNEATYADIPVGPLAAQLTITVARHGSSWWWHSRDGSYAGTGFATPKAALMAICVMVTRVFGASCAVDRDDITKGR